MPRRRILARVLLIAAIVFAVTMALLPKSPHLPLDGLDDTYQHMLAFATLSTLAAWCYPKKSPFRIDERLSFLGALIEAVQAIPSLHRDCDIRDWIAHTPAIAPVLTLVALSRRRSGRRAAT